MVDFPKKKQKKKMKPFRLNWVFTPFHAGYYISNNQLKIEVSIYTNLQF